MEQFAVSSVISSLALFSTLSARSALAEYTSDDKSQPYVQQAYPNYYQTPARDRQLDLIGIGLPVRITAKKGHLSNCSIFYYKYIEVDQMPIR